MLTCSTCAHWARMQTHGAVDLSTTQIGQCRGAPPQLVVVGMQNGTPALAPSVYPPVAGSNPACGFHKVICPPVEGT